MKENDSTRTVCTIVLRNILAIFDL